MCRSQRIASSVLLLATACFGARVTRHNHLEGAGDEAAEKTLHGVVQALRYLTDHEGADKSLLQKMWIPTMNKNARILGATMKDLENVERAFKEVPKIRQLAETSVEDTKDFLFPAGVFSLMVEVWDWGILSGSLIGETGVPLQMGTQEFTLPLQKNEYRNPYTQKTQDLGTVTFETSFGYDDSSTTPCPGKEDSVCAVASLRVTCKSAADLPRLGTTISKMFDSKPDPYCKIRLKEMEDSVSTKDKTQTIKDTANPTWTTDNVFEYKWLTMIVEDGGERVPWTYDKMTVVEQVEASTRLLAKIVALGGKECDEIDRMSKSQAKVCKAMVEMDKGELDEDLVSEVEAALSEEDAQTLHGIVNPSGEPGDESFLEVDEEDLEEEEQATAVKFRRYGGHRYGRRHGRRHGGRRYIRTSNPGELILCIAFFLIICALL